jgi:hypothetical protein
MEKLTLSEIKARSTGYFFDKSTMKFFSSGNWQTSKQQTKYGTKYDKEKQINYVVITDPWGNKHYHKFNDDGSLSPVSDQDIPSKFLE